MSMNPIAWGIKYNGYAKQVSKVVRIQPSVLLAQWGVESGWGVSNGYTHHNIANIKAQGNDVLAHGTFDDSTGTYYNYDNWSDGFKAYGLWLNSQPLYNSLHGLKTYQESCLVLGTGVHGQEFATSQYRLNGTGAPGSLLVEIIVHNHFAMYDSGYNNIAGNPNVKPTSANNVANSTTATPTSYIKRPQVFHKGLTPPIPVHSPSSIATPKKKITSSAGAIAKGTKNNTDGPERTLKIASLSFVGIVAILFFIGHAFIPTETL
jgi:hypothetical protein